MCDKCSYCMVRLYGTISPVHTQTRTLTCTSMHLHFAYCEIFDVNHSCADQECFVRRGPNLITFWCCFFLLFFSWWGERGSKYRYKWAIIGLSAKRHFNGDSLAGRWWPNIKCWLGSFVNFLGIWTSTAKKPFIFVIFHGRGSGPPAPPPLWIRPWTLEYQWKVHKDQHLIFWLFQSSFLISL